MDALAFLTDGTLDAIAGELLTHARDAQDRSRRAFARNVIDPFAALFETSGFGLEHDVWLTGERTRQAQKSLQNHIGGFHQKLLGKIPGWVDLGQGEVFDLAHAERKLVAEVKNKFNTLNAAGAARLYGQLADAVSKKGHQYYGYTAYYVEIIPRKPERYDQPFTPSDPSTGSPCPEHPRVRRIDGHSFYALATGVPDALDQVFEALLSRAAQLGGHAPSAPDALRDFFRRAYHG